jgi:hypothetical protein
VKSRGPAADGREGRGWVARQPVAIPRRNSTNPRRTTLSYHLRLFPCSYIPNPVSIHQPPCQLTPLAPPTERASLYSVPPPKKTLNCECRCGSCAPRNRPSMWDIRPGARALNTGKRGYTHDSACARLLLSISTPSVY